MKLIKSFIKLIIFVICLVSCSDSSSNKSEQINNETVLKTEILTCNNVKIVSDCWRRIVNETKECFFSETFSGNRGRLNPEGNICEFENKKMTFEPSVLPNGIFPDDKDMIVKLYVTDSLCLTVDSTKDSFRFISNVGAYFKAVYSGSEVRFYCQNTEFVLSQENGNVISNNCIDDFYFFYTYGNVGTPISNVSFSIDTSESNNRYTSHCDL